MVVKINVSISKETLEELDAAAREANTSRSAFMTKAVKHFLEEKREAALRERRRQAAREIDMIREKAEPWDATAEVIKWRDRH
jgi:metal-responsive CopG/Arc/MetJ family transcriptional regulator